ncbi:hypothetical protein BDQ12DRAFT_730098 [Crucibulum laeve]|uniref:Uncharacterized protein n=1 Tax=Crucibulum laeve TaxID=68775 RepID=A0A5C3LGE8_9AGAR|nr:hypothetical protein BDQ12DRAFT_730098 [Crucibulum laeve]
MPLPPQCALSLDNVEGEGSILLNAEFPAHTLEEQKALTEKRLLEVMNYVRKPDNGTMCLFDAEEFVVRMLKSALGFVLVGDFITAQLFYALGYAPHALDIAFQEDPPHLHRFTHTFGVNTPISTPGAFDPPLPTNAAGTPPIVLTSSY